MACPVKDGNELVVAMVTVDAFSPEAVSVDYVDIAHSINGRFLKKTGDSRSSTRESGLGQESLPATAISEVVVSDFLEIVTHTQKRSVG